MNNGRRMRRIIPLALLVAAIAAALLLTIAGCDSDRESVHGTLPAGDVADRQTPEPVLSRADAIPAGAVKVSPETDAHPPQLHSNQWAEPVPVSGAVNTAGAEDSPFITPDGNTLYFFFTPDPDVPVEEQLRDGLTGIWVSHQSNGRWQEPERVMLQDPGKLALDGCTFVQGDTMWFCSAREGYTGLHWFTARLVDGEWTDWKNVDFDPQYAVGELHISADGTRLFFHSGRPGGLGKYDIWASRKTNGNWTEPENVAAVNSPAMEGWPYLTSDGSELWFLRTHEGSPGVFRSQKSAGSWSEPELILSGFAGEPALDEAGNLYFVHHFYREGQMIEADIYVARKK